MVPLRSDGSGRSGLHVLSLLLDGLQDVELDATVLLLALGILVVRDGFVRTITLGGHTSLVDAFVDQVLHDGVGALLRQGSVLIGGTDVVGVSGDFDEEDLLVDVENAGDGVENREARGSLDLVAAGGELDALEDLDVVVGDFDEAHALVRTTVFVLDAVERLGFGRALVDMVRNAVLVGVDGFVRTTVGVFHAVDDLGYVRTFVGLVEDLIVVDVRFGAAVGVFEAVGVLRFGLALIELVGDAVFVGIRAAVILLVAEFAVFVGALVFGVADAVLVTIREFIRTTVIVADAVDDFLLVRALVFRVEDAVLIVVVIEAAVVVFEFVFVLGDRRTLIFLVVDAVVVFIAHFVHERDAGDRAEQGDADALDDAAAAADGEGEREAQGGDLSAAVDFE